MTRFLVVILFALAGVSPAVQAVEPAALGDFALAEPMGGDLDEIRERRLVRVVVPYDSTHYFLDGPTPRGLSYELLKLFETWLNEKLSTGREPIVVVAIPTTRDQFLPRLEGSLSDLAIGSLTVTPERKERVDFSVPIASDVREVVVTGPAWRGELTAPKDLSGREVWVRASSSYHESLRTLSAALEQDGLEPVRIRFAKEVLETERLLEMVNGGLLPGTIADEPIARFWSQFFPDLRVQPVAVREGATYAWAARKGMPRFLALVDEFVAANRARTYTGNVLLKRYLKDTTWAKRARADESMKRLRPMVELFRKYAELYDLEWQMVAAQAYQESGLDPNARNPSGAVGLMQLLPSTARDMGIEDIEQPEPNIHAGTKYLRFLIDRYFDDPEIEPLDQMLFALASYNVGPSRMRRLRAKAAEEGVDPNKWFGHVERVAGREVSREPVRYVSNIYQYHLAYRIVTDEEMGPASRGGD